MEEPAWLVAWKARERGPQPQRAGASQAQT